MLLCTWLSVAPKLFTGIKGVPFLLRKARKLCKQAGREKKVPARTKVKWKDGQKRTAYRAAKPGQSDALFAPNVNPQKETFDLCILDPGGYSACFFRRSNGRAEKEGQRGRETRRLQRPGKGRFSEADAVERRRPERTRRDYG
jgi:hypothetical protein